jgi:hypothetical protein
MTNTQKYLQSLKKCETWVTVLEWAEKVSELYPEILEDANKQVQTHAKETTGLRAITARLSSKLSSNDYENIEIDDSERPRRVRYVSESDREERINEELEADVEPLTRKEKIQSDSKKLTTYEQYRVDEFYALSGQFKKYFDLDFEVDHAKALLNADDAGTHHPSNLQLLIKAHNAKKNKKNWERFSFEEQKQYIEQVVALQMTIASRLEIELVDEVLEKLFGKLEEIY